MQDLYQHQANRKEVLERPYYPAILGLCTSLYMYQKEPLTQQKVAVSLLVLRLGQRPERHQSTRYQTTICRLTRAS